MKKLHLILFILIISLTIGTVTSASWLSDLFCQKQINENYSDNGTYGATILTVPRGGTGASSFTEGECIVGHGTGALTSQACGSGGGGTDGNWVYDTDGNIRLATTSLQVLIGATATTTDSALEVLGDITANYFTATSTTATSTIHGAISIGTSTPTGIFPSATSSYPRFFKNPATSLNILGAVDQDINLKTQGTGMVTISGGWGLGFEAADSGAPGPDYGDGVCGINYRPPVESMTDDFLIFRCGQYVIENDLAQWMMIITPTGVNIGSGANDTDVPVSKFEVYGNASIGQDYARLKAAPANGLNVQGITNIGTSTSVSSNMLHVVGNTRPLVLQRNTAGTGSLYIDYLDYLGNEKGYFGYGSGANENFTIANLLDSDMNFYNDSGYALTIKKDTGNLGIGSTTPAEKLELGTGGNILLPNNQAIKFYSSAGVSSSILAVSSSNNTTLSAISGNDVFINGSGTFALKSNGSVGINDATPASKLSVIGNVNIGYDAAAPTNGLIVSGNVGIGTSSPHTKLTVNGDAYFAGTITATSTATSTIAGDLMIGEGTDAFIVNYNGSVGIGSTTSSGILNLGSNPTTTNASSTIMAGKIQWDGYDATGARICSFFVGTTLTTVTGACTP